MTHYEFSFRHEERKKAMEDLIHMARKGGNGAKWDEHFKTLLLLLLETLGDKDVSYTDDDVFLLSRMYLRINWPRRLILHAAMVDDGLVSSFVFC